MFFIVYVVISWGMGLILCKDPLILSVLPMQDKEE